LGDGYEITNGVATKYVNAAGGAVAKRVGTTSDWLHGDLQGSANLGTDASGTEGQGQKFRPYGEQVPDPTGLAESLGYVGERQDESGLLYLHARYLDPAMGRFVSPDPLSQGGSLVGLNGYAYANDNPINFSDRKGLCAGADFCSETVGYTDW